MGLGAERSGLGGPWRQQRKEAATEVWEMPVPPGKGASEPITTRGWGRREVAGLAQSPELVQLQESGRTEREWGPS